MVMAVRFVVQVDLAVGCCRDRGHRNPHANGQPIPVRCVMSPQCVMAAVGNSPVCRLI